MTTQKKLKQAIRTRAKKTGESYTAARRHILEARKVRAPAKPKPAGMSYASVLARTGHDLDHWFAVLDKFAAPHKGHTASARYLHESHAVPGWHSQGITVAYERTRGLRAVNQRMDGQFEVAVSKVVAAPMERVAQLLGRSVERAAWLRDCDPEIAKGVRDAFVGPRAKTVKIREGKDAYVRVRCDGATVEIRASAKADGRSTVYATATKIPTATAKEAQRSAWRRALEALKSHL